MVAGRPLVAGKFGCRVVRGPDWQYGDEEATRGQGAVLEPDNGILEEWASGGISGACGGECNPAWGMHTGGWWLDRSCVVQWLGSGAIYYYRAGDNDKFDLYEIVAFPMRVALDLNHHYMKVIARARVVIGELQDKNKQAPASSAASSSSVGQVARLQVIDQNLVLLVGLTCMGLDQLEFENQAYEPNSK